MTVRLTLELALPVMGIGIVGALVATMLDVARVPEFSMKSLTPNFAKFNPAEGIKNIFALKSLIDLLKSTAKIIIFFVCIYFYCAAFLVMSSGHDLRHGVHLRCRGTIIL